MARPKKIPDYNQNSLEKQFIDMIVEAYQRVSEGASDSDGHRQLKEIAEEFGLSTNKIRKILITAGVFENATSLLVNKLYTEGKSVSEIQKSTGLCASSVRGYLPYSKSVYKMEENTLLAERLIRYRARKKGVDELQAVLRDKHYLEAKDKLWEVLALFDGYAFYTVKGKLFRFTLKGNEIFVNRKEKSVTRASFDYALDAVVRLKSEGAVIAGPKMIGCYGDSYIYAIFARLGVL